ncbi:DUF493 domain-containing protein, partial [Vibrio parahaemolyticus]|nr:DUF493 domain-containing protein [Vibrio parahaemolyticus]
MPIREELWEFPHAMQLKVLGAADTLPEMKSAVVDILET